VVLGVFPLAPIRKTGTVYDSRRSAGFDVDAALPLPLRSGIVTIHPKS